MLALDKGIFGYTVPITLLMLSVRVNESLNAQEVKAILDKMTVGVFKLS